MKTLLAALLLLTTAVETARADTIPAPVRTRYVASTSQLNNVLSTALPGDHIVLANATYAGFTDTRSGDSANPIVIRATNILGARVSGDIYIKGNAVWLVGVTGKRVYIEGADDRLSRSYFSGASFPITVKPSARRAQIDHNEIDNKDQGGIVKEDRAGLRMDYTAGVSDYVYAHHVHHNYFHNTPRGPAPEPDNNAIASSTMDRTVRTGVVIEYNLVADWYGGRCIYTKSHANTIRYNTCVNGNEAVYNRVGNENLWLANWLENIPALVLYGRDHSAIGNTMTDGGIWLMMGTCSSLTSVSCPAPNQQAAANTLLAGNIGKLVIGKRPTVTNGVTATVPVVDIRSRSACHRQWVRPGHYHMRHPSGDHVLDHPLGADPASGQADARRSGAKRADGA